MSQLQFGFENYIGPVIGKTARLIANTINKALSANGYKVSLEQMITLNILKSREGISQQEVASLWQKNKASITNLIDQLEKSKLVVRVPDKSDRRNKLLYLTTEGKKQQSKMNTIAKTTADKLLIDIKQEELDICIKVLKQIANNCTKY